MITEVKILPQAFITQFRVEVTVDEKTRIILRFFSPEDRILKMMSWDLIKGTNITQIENVKCSNGLCRLDILDIDGNLLRLMTIEKINKESTSKPGPQ